MRKRSAVDNKTARPAESIREAVNVKEIKAVSFVSEESGPVPTDSLDEKQREALSRWLRITYLTELCRGKASVRWVSE